MLIAAVELLALENVETVTVINMYVVCGLSYFYFRFSRHICASVAALGFVVRQRRVLCI